MTDKKTPDRIVIIGAGLGGLAAAALLASSGKQVTVFEHNRTPGGKMQEFRSGGFRFDTGPSLLTLPEVLQTLFRHCNEETADWLRWVEPEPVCRYFYPDGTVFNNYRDRQHTLEEIRRFAPEDSEAYSEFLDYSGELFRRTREAFLFNPLHGVRDLRHLKWLDFFRIDAFRTVSGRIDHTFRSEYMRIWSKRFTTYTGSSPYRAPATLNMIPHIELSRGGFYLKGGMYRLAEALEAIARKNGAQFRYETPVHRIETSDGSVCGIRYGKNERLPCRRILSNADATETLLHLLEPAALSRFQRRRQKNQEPSLSGFVMMLGVNRSWPELHHHNLFFSSDYPKEFRQIFRDRQMPDDPTLYVSNSSATDPEDAPPGSSNLFILANAPCLWGEQNWDHLEKEYAGRIVHKLESYGLEGLSRSIQLRKYLTPVDFQRLYRANRGSIYGSSSNGRLSAFLRPGNKLRSVEGLYMAGGSTHPGGGIPLVLLSAMHAVELIRRDESRQIRHPG